MMKQENNPENDLIGNILNSVELASYGFAFAQIPIFFLQIKVSDEWWLPMSIFGAMVLPVVAFAARGKHNANA